MAATDAFGKITIMDKFGRAGQEVPIMQDRWVFGSGGSCDIQLRRKDVLEQHATLHRDEHGHVWLHPESKGETMIQGEQIETQSRLYHGDIITIGTRDFTFEYIVQPQLNSDAEEDDPGTIMSIGLKSLESADKENTVNSVGNSAGQANSKKRRKKALSAQIKRSSLSAIGHGATSGGLYAVTESGSNTMHLPGQGKPSLKSLDVAKEAAAKKRVSWARNDTPLANLQRVGRQSTPAVVPEKHQSDKEEPAPVPVFEEEADLTDEEDEMDTCLIKRKLHAVLEEETVCEESAPEPTQLATMDQTAPPTPAVEEEESESENAGAYVRAPNGSGRKGKKARKAAGVNPIQKIRKRSQRRVSLRNSRRKMNTAMLVPHDASHTTPRRESVPFDEEVSVVVTPWTSTSKSSTSPTQGLPTPLEVPRLTIQSPGNSISPLKPMPVAQKREEQSDVEAKPTQTLAVATVPAPTTPVRQNCARQFMFGQDTLLEGSIVVPELPSLTAGEEMTQEEEKPNLTVATAPAPASPLRQDCGRRFMFGQDTLLEGPIVLPELPSLTAAKERAIEEEEEEDQQEKDKEEIQEVATQEVEALEKDTESTDVKKKAKITTANLPAPAPLPVTKADVHEDTPRPVSAAKPSRLRSNRSPAPATPVEDTAAKAPRESTPGPSGAKARMSGVGLMPSLTKRSPSPRPGFGSSPMRFAEPKQTSTTPANKWESTPQRPASKPVRRAPASTTPKAKKIIDKSSTSKKMPTPVRNKIDRLMSSAVSKISSAVAQSPVVVDKKVGEVGVRKLATPLRSAIHELRKETPKAEVVVENATPEAVQSAVEEVDMARKLATPIRSQIQALRKASPSPVRQTPTEDESVMTASQKLATPLRKQIQSYRQASPASSKKASTAPAAEEVTVPAPAKLATPLRSQIHALRKPSPTPVAKNEVQDAPVEGSTLVQTALPTPIRNEIQSRRRRSSARPVSPALVDISGEESGEGGVVGMEGDAINETVAEIIEPIVAHEVVAAIESGVNEPELHTEVVNEPEAEAEVEREVDTEVVDEREVLTEVGNEPEAEAEVVNEREVLTEVVAEPDAEAEVVNEREAHTEVVNEREVLTEVVDVIPTRRTRRKTTVASTAPLRPTRNRKTMAATSFTTVAQPDTSVRVEVVEKAPESSIEADTDMPVREVEDVLPKSRSRRKTTVSVAPAEPAKTVSRSTRRKTTVVAVIEPESSVESEESAPKSRSRRKTAAVEVSMEKELVEAPEPARRSRRKTIVSTVEAEAVTEAPAVEAPAKRNTRRRTAAVVLDVPVSMEEAEPEVVEEAPKRSTSRRKTRAVVVEPEPVAPKARTTRGRKGSAEPSITDAEETAQPSRKRTRKADTEEVEPVPVAKTRATRSRKARTVSVEETSTAPKPATRGRKRVAEEEESIEEEVKPAPKRGRNKGTSESSVEEVADEAKPKRAARKTKVEAPPAEPVRVTRSLRSRK